MAVDVIRHIEFDTVRPYLPSGPNLRFRFPGIKQGAAIVTFNSGTPIFVVVEDTVIVR